MKQLFYGLAALLLLCGQLSFAQEPKKEQPKDMTPPGSAGMMLATAEEMAGLRLGLLAAERKTLEVRADWLRAEQKAFQSDVSLWEKSRADLQKHLDNTFWCKYDLDRRACEPKAAPAKTD